MCKGWSVADIPKTAEEISYLPLVLLQKKVFTNACLQDLLVDNQEAFLCFNGDRTNVNQALCDYVDFAGALEVRLEQRLVEWNIEGRKTYTVSQDFLDKFQRTQEFQSSAVKWNRVLPKEVWVDLSDIDISVVFPRDDIAGVFIRKVDVSCNSVPLLEIDSLFINKQGNVVKHIITQSDFRENLEICRGLTGDENEDELEFRNGIFFMYYLIATMAE